MILDFFIWVCNRLPFLIFYGLVRLMIPSWRLRKWYRRYCSRFGRKYRTVEELLAQVKWEKTLRYKLGEQYCRW